MSSENGSAIAPVPLAIIGIGCLFPKAENARTYWLNIKNGVDSIGPVPPSHWNPDDYLNPDPKALDRTYAARGGFLDAVDFRPLDFGIAPNDLEATDTSQLLGLVAAKQALTDAGYGPDRDFDRNRVSVVLGVTGTLELVIPLGARLGHPRWRKALRNAGVSPETTDKIIAEIGDSYVGWQENSFPGLLGNVVAGRIANRLDLGGTNCVVDAACASSLSAIHLAGLELAAGRCDMAVSGGVDTFNDIFMFMCFSKTPALSPTGDAKPFDSHGDGTILGEGLGIVVLKRLADAERDGDDIYAVIRSVGTSSDGKGNAIYAPSAAGQVKALRSAYGLAGITPDTIELVEAHGTGTRVGDAAEVTALTEVFRAARAEGTWCALGSVKSQIGHTKAAAGAAGLIKAALALHTQVLPPTIKVKEPIEGLEAGKSPFYINTDKRPWVSRPEHPRRAAVSAFGFGGSNFHCVLEEHRCSSAIVDWDNDVEIVALSANDTDSLGRKLDGWRHPGSWTETQCLAAETRSAFRAADPCRLLLIIGRESDRSKIVDLARARLHSEPKAHFWRIPEGAYFGAGPSAGRLAVIFPGQGSQYAGMLRDLACTFPKMRHVLADANRIFDRMTGEKNGERLSDLIYPHPAFSKAQRDRHDKRLRETQVAQPAIGAVSIGALKILEDFGVNPHAYAGHSYGELPALCAAGCFDDEALHAMSRLRGNLMASYHGGDAGCMLAVHAPLTSIEAILQEESLDLVVANRNAPTQSVLSGRSSEIDRAVACLDRRAVRHTKLAVPAAFHSSLVASAMKPFRDALGDVAFHAAGRHVYANTSGDLYPVDLDSMREVLAGQLANPVDFVREISTMAIGGVRTFLEVGPGSTLTGLVSSILNAPENSPILGWDAFALDASSGRRSGVLDLAHVLARLAARGYGVDLSPWQQCRKREATTPSGKPGLVIPICGANYVQPKKKVASKSLTPTVLQTSSAPQPAVETPTPAVSAGPESMPKPAPTNIHSTKPMQAHRSAHSPHHTNGTESRPSELPVKPEALAQALQVTQQSLAAFASLQEQTAQLHKQFLENQEAAQRTLQMLVEQQQALLTGAGSTLAPTRIAPIPQSPANEARPAPSMRNGHSHQVKPAAVSPRTPPVADPETKKAEIPVPRRSSDITPILLAVVAEKTGYPAEMLSPEMALDADLGIDSIKRVEIFSALQERLPDAPAVKPEHLGTLHTLGDVIAFLSASVSNPAVVSSKQLIGSDSENINKVLLEVIAEKTGYPAEMLTPEMALDADLGIDSIKRVEIFSALQERLPNAPSVKPENLGTIHRLGDIVAFLSQNGATVQPRKPAPVESNGHAQPFKPVKALEDCDELIERLVLRAARLDRHSSMKAPIVSGATIIVVADASPLLTQLLHCIEQDGCRPHPVSWDQAPTEIIDAAGLVLVAPNDRTVDDLALRAFRWLRHLGPGIKRAAADGGGLFATVSRLDGSFGLGNLALTSDVRQGALAGLAKTASHEWPEVACKAIDLAPDLENAGKRIWDESRLQGPIEVGISASGMIALELDASSARSIVNDPRPLNSSDVVLITGGARGVTAAVAQVIAKRFQPTIVLMGRTNIEAPEPEWLRDCHAEPAIKRAIARTIAQPAAPKIIEEQFRQVIAKREALRNIDSMRRAGSRVIYYSADVADLDAVKSVVRALPMPVTCLIHGAGVLADKRIEELSDEQFAAVFATKVTGLETLLTALRESPLKHIALFSSSTGRYGRTGQAAYAAANEAINKIAQQQARTRPDCKVASINWGPWDGGMVTPARRSMFESEGVGVIPLDRGAEVLIGELTAEKSEVEVTVIARPMKRTPSAVVAPAASSLQLAFEQQISLRNHPILASHIFDGRHVLPFALHLEWLAQAAMHSNPGYAFHGLNDLRLLQGVVLEEKGSIPLKTFAGKPQRCEGEIIIPVELHGKRGANEVVHSRAEVVLVQRLPFAQLPSEIPSMSPYPHPIDDIYRRFLFHGPMLAGVERIDGISGRAISGVSRTAPAPSAWLLQPMRSAWISDPMVIDAAFQLMILWSFAEQGAGSLPCFIGKYRQYRRTFPAGSIGIGIRITHENGALARADVDFTDADGGLVARMLDYECVIDEKLNRAFRKNRILERVAAEGNGSR